MNMNAQDVKVLGYEVKWASAFEVGLIKNGQGCRTWWAKDFDGKLPPLDHTLILEAVFKQESLERWFTKSN